MNGIGIDIGTQSLKVAIVEDGRRLRALASVPYGIRFPRPGWVEQDPQLWEEALGEAVPEALRQAQLVAEDIDCIGIAGQLDGCLAVDENTQALTPCLVWMDRRAASALPVLDAEQLARFRATTGLVPDASHMAAKIRWLVQEHPELTGARFHQPSSYLVERLCGAYVFDHGLASTTMLYDLSTRDYDDAQLSSFSISREQVPAIAPADSLAGRLSQRGARACHLRAGTPVAVGTGDDFATPLGAGLAQPGPMVCVLGTAEVVGAVCDSPVIDSAALVETHGYLERYFVENPGWLSGGALIWLRQLLGIESDAALDALAARAPIGCEGLTFIPALSGAMAPEWQAKARGCFYGLTAHHGREHMARAVLEGCAFAMRDVRDRLRQLGLSADPILLLGGGARSELWAQIRADLCQVTVEANQEPDSCAVGAGLIATAAVSPRTSLTELASAWPHVVHRTQPRPSAARPSQRAYERYRQLFAALRPMWT